MMRYNRVQKVVVFSALFALSLCAGCANSEDVTDEGSNQYSGESGNENSSEQGNGSGGIVVGGACNSSNYLPECAVTGERVQCNGGIFVSLGACEDGKVCVSGSCKASSENGNGENGNGNGNGGNGEGEGGNGEGGNGNGENGNGNGENGNGENGNGENGNGENGNGENGNGGNEQNVCDGASYTCSNPIELSLNNNVSVKSVCGKAEHTGSKCGSSIKNTTNAEAVIHFKIAQTGYYNFEFTNMTARNWALYASTACDGEDMVMRDWCSDGDDSLTLTSKLMNAGDYYLFIETEDPEDATAHVSASYSMSSKQGVLACISGEEKETSGGEIIDLSDKSATLTFTGKTSTGTDYWKTAASNGLLGKEVIYSFHLDQASKVRAILSDITPETNNKNLGYIYVFVSECDSATGGTPNAGTVYNRNLAKLAYSSETPASLTLVSGDTFSPGTYNLVVGSSNTYDFSYSLTFALVNE